MGGCGGVGGGCAPSSGRRRAGGGGRADAPDCCLPLRRRIDDTQATWQMPQGGIDPMENPLQAALRELHEETGMTSVRIVASIDRWLDYEFPTKVRAQLGGPWVRYRGQTQKWLLLQFDGADAEVDLERHGPAEFSEWRWMALEELPRSVVGFKRGVYECVACHFCPRIERIRAERA